MTYDYTLDELKALGTRSQALQDELKRNPGPVTLKEIQHDISLSRTERIAYLDTQRDKYPIPGPIPDVVREEDVYVDYPTSGTKIQVRVYSPANSGSGADEAGLPVIVLMHEGGFILGDISDEQHNARLFVASFDCVVLNVEYLLAPENAFPNAHLSSYHIIETVCLAPETFHPLADPAKGLVLGGSSAGGNLSLILAHHARQQKLSPPVTGVWLGVPFVFPLEKVPAKYKFLYHSGSKRDDPIIDPGENEEGFKGMLAASQISDLDSPLVRLHYNG
jgi:acetyl esterase/lipase